MCPLKRAFHPCLRMFFALHPDRVQYAERANLLQNPENIKIPGGVSWIEVSNQRLADRSAAWVQGQVVQQHRNRLDSISRLFGLKSCPRIEIFQSCTLVFCTLIRKVLCKFIVGLLST